jgi:large subunit ribosomal protein L3
VIEGLIGKKVGMTQIFNDNGTVTPVTVIEAGPCVVVQCRTPECDGYSAVQIGLVDAKAATRANRPTRGRHEKAGVPPTRIQREFSFDEGTELKPGDPIAVSIFEGVTRVDIIGTTKGRGFQGVMKRHGFGGGKATHGSMHHRAPGSIGRSASPSRVFPGQGMPGQMGNKGVTVKNAKVVKVDADRNLLFIKGGIPGARNSYIRIVKVS